MEAIIRAGLADVPGVAGLALGGSRARGNASPDSDWDIGLYYDEPPDFDVLLDAVGALGEVDGFGRDSAVGASRFSGCPTVLFRLSHILTVGIDQ